jgi:hypothetical protein
MHLLFQPFALRRSDASPFTGAKRLSDVLFPCVWKEADEIHIQLPDGFSLDNADSPGSLSFGESGAFNLKMAATNAEPQDLYTSRELTFGNHGLSKNYKTVKKIFDEIEIRDGHSLSLKAS